MSKVLNTIREEGLTIAGRKLYVRGEKLWNEVLSTAAYQIVDSMPVFAPYAMGPYAARAKLAILAANETFPLLTKLIAETRNAGLLSVSPVERFCRDEASRAAASALKALFDKYGSDKAHFHHYESLYGSILWDPASVESMLEIGLGTNNIGVVSHMGAAGKPGASLRAFRDFLPNAAIYGADIDRGILFTEDRIKTFFVDQTDLSSFEDLGREVGEGLDLIIDDGLHCPNANLAVLLFALKKLKAGGWFVVEDIPDAALPVWQVVAALLPSDHQCSLIAAGEANMFAVRKPS